MNGWLISFNKWLYGGLVYSGWLISQVVHWLGGWLVVCAAGEYGFVVIKQQRVLEY